MKRVLSYSITKKENGISIREYLTARGYSRHIRTYIKQHPGALMRNERPALFYETLLTGDQLKVTLEDELPSESILPVKLPLSIVYEDEDLMIINKAADTPIHPSMGNHENTLANAVAWYFAEQKIPFVYRCINRLDRDTTGLLILAKHMLSGAILSAQMKERQIHRTYLAIVEGQTPPRGTIDLPIGRVCDSLILRQIDRKQGETAVTHYERLSVLTPDEISQTGAKFQGELPKDGLSLIRLKLDTGRTHQIRVHMTAIGHPLIGDTMYNPNYADSFSSYGGQNFPYAKRARLMTRQALHSSSLEFVHPITGLSMKFTAPLPEDMAYWFCQS